MIHVGLHGYGQNIDGATVASLDATAIQPTQHDSPPATAVVGLLLAFTTTVVMVTSIVVSGVRAREKHA